MAEVTGSEAEQQANESGSLVDREGVHSDDHEEPALEDAGQAQAKDLDERRRSDSEGQSRHRIGHLEELKDSSSDSERQEDSVTEVRAPCLLYTSPSPRDS